jgi:hypothetical protein
MPKNSTRLFRGLPVIDATMAMVLHVRRSDLVGGYTMLQNYCVVAHAIKREQHREAWVHRSMAFVREGDHWVRYRLTGSLKLEVMVHDRGGEFKAGDYRLSPPPPSIHFGAAAYTAQKQRTLANYHKSKKKPTGKPARAIHITEGVRERARYGGEFK